MEVEKKRSKGFFNLFDWNGKSRKKLFSSNSESSGSQQGKENVENFSQTRLNRVEVDEKGASSSNKGSSDWNCASSVTSDEGGGSRAPGVVARLMGLDSLPTSTVTDSSSTLSIDSHSLRVPHHDRVNPNLWGDFYAMDYMNMPNKLDTVSRNPVESRAQRVQNRPIERFQTEVLPPKSAKSIPVTHHKLLSPIKTPGFIPTKNAAYIMEAAAKMIETSPRESSKSEMSSMRSSSIPLRIRDLKEKMEVVSKVSRPERPKGPSDTKYMKGRPGYRSYNGSDNVPVPKASVDSEKQNYNDIRNKGKAVPLAVQAKANVQRKEGSPPLSNRSFADQKEQNEVKQIEFSKSRQSTQRPVHKRTSAVSNKSVLKQNNQKQNCVSNRDKMTSKNVVPNQPSRRMRSTNGSSRPNRTVNKVLINSETGSRKMGSVATATGKDFSFSTVKDVSGKIRSASQDFHLEETAADNGLIGKDERSVKCNVAMEGYTNLCTDNRKQDMDVVSFTFTSPLKKSISELQSTGQVVSMNNRFCIDSFGNNDQHSYPEHFTFSSPGLNVIGGDALSVLLEQKLQELTCKVESSQHNLFGEGTSASSSSSLQDLVSSEASTTSRGKKFELGLLRDKVDDIADFDFPSPDVNQKWQGPEGMEECSSSSKNSGTGKDFNYHLNPVSVFGPSFESGSCTDNRSSANGCESERCSFAQAQDQINLFSTFEIQPCGASELSDSAFYWEVSGKNMTRIFGFHSPNQSNDWEREYVQYILSKVDLVIEDFALGDADYAISPNLFDNLHYQEEYPKLQQKLLFDSVNESLHNRCRQIVVGSWKAWDRWETLSQRKESLAEELYKEISVWKNMGDLMADDLVDKDMSTQRGRWLDFEIEAFEEAVEIEKGILGCLVDELVSDFLLY
ncbi:uncharacterized protein LOC133721798 [Rosa rugosa]|uniref:uncharacterized protein LOC133721798 n=1 Tax=Rosa rugosa TaxID=74645 RepID=UPI002B4094B4|nr:uncharacterized protein LOC133721798 [Rosa rugosa]